MNKGPVVFPWVFTSGVVSILDQYIPMEKTGNSFKESNYPTRRNVNNTGIYHYYVYSEVSQY